MACDEIKRGNQMTSIKRQAGLSLVETMIGLALSMIVVASMVGLMSNSMGTATRIIQMSQLTDELRNVMSMMSRDVRRANYNPNSIYCYGNADCATDGSASQVVGDIDIASCDDYLRFNLDRDWDGAAVSDPAGAFRRVTVNSAKAGGQVGVMQMWVGGASPNCDPNSNANWLQVTDPGFVDVTNFEVDNLGFSGSVSSGAGTLTQSVRVVDLVIEGELILDRRIRKQVRDRIRIRNDYFL